MLREDTVDFLEKNRLIPFIFSATSFLLIFTIYQFAKSTMNQQNFKQNLLNSDEGYQGKIDRNLMTNNSSIRQFLDEMNNAKSVYEMVQGRKYKGTWVSQNKNDEFMHFDNNFGELDISFEKEQVAFLLNDGNFTDNRMKFAFIINFNNHVTKEYEFQYKLTYHFNLFVSQLEYLTDIKKQSN